jgi:hypothetical protein
VESYKFKANSERNGVQVEKVWAQKNYINWKGEHHELEVCIPKMNKKMYGEG